jgi:outer membrane scaffolding protein for murein synthesis (MipA/OmpV family)
MKFVPLSAMLLCGTILSLAAPSYARDAWESDDKLDVMIGVSAATVAEYAGAEDQEFLVLPAVVVDYEFHENNHLFVNTFKGAGYEFDGERIVWGLQSKWRRGRDDNDSQLLAGMGDLDDTFTAGFYGGLDFGPFRVLAEYDAGLDNNNDGVLTTFSARYNMESVERPMTGYVSAKAVYGDDAYHDAYFGSEGLAGVRPFYEADAGWVGVGINAGVDYLLAEHHYFRFDTEYMGLSTDVTNSPLTEGSYQYSAKMTYGYKF